MNRTAFSDAQIREKLKSTFGFSSFRPLQEGIVKAILGGEDVFVLMPTGGGKSLCYQLPALLLDELVVVVSPLIALMKDQVDGLQALGVPATFINSSLDPSEIGERQGAVARGDIKLLYVAPERLMAPGFLHLISSRRVAFFAIDEAHCISEWGHDFRPEYRELRHLREFFPEAAFGSFTATATPRVQADIKAHLKLERAGSFQGSFNRPNLYYEVRPKNAAYEQLLSYLQGRREDSGIIYCQTRAGTENLAGRLRDHGFRAEAYHAGLDREERRQRQEAFSRDDLQIIVATIAFGMGIDKPNVRFVIHYDLPKNLEGYYQESGRGGRDGEPCDCLLFFTYGEMMRHQALIDQKGSEPERQIARRQLLQMVDWAAGIACRRRALLAYFGEDLQDATDPCCDVCSAPKEEVDSTVAAQKFLSCAVRTGERFGSLYLIQVLRGSRSERILRFGHDELPTYGIGQELSIEEWRHLAGELMRGGHIWQSPDEYNAIKVTSRGKEVLFRGEKVRVSRPVQVTPPPAASAVSQYQERLFGELRALRKNLADERRVVPHVIFNDPSLQQMAKEMPATEEHFRRLQGVGERKAELFAQAFLNCIAGYVRQNGPPPVKQTLKRRKEGELSDTVQATLNLFFSGKNLTEIAAERSLVLSTIENHLAEAIESGITLDLDRLVAKEKQEAIAAAMRELGPAPLKPIMEKLGEGYTYGELKFVRAALGLAGAPAEG